MEKNISVLIRDDKLKNINFFKKKNLNESIFFLKALDLKVILELNQFLIINFMKKIFQ